MRAIVVECEALHSHATLAVIKSRLAAESSMLLPLHQGTDILITSGGVSMGDRDLVKPLLERRGTVHFGRVKVPHIGNTSTNLLLLCTY